jgi:hypothetical protein
MDRLEKWHRTKEMTIKNRLRKRTHEQKQKKATRDQSGEPTLWRL